MKVNFDRKYHDMWPPHNELPHGWKAPLDNKFWLSKSTTPNPLAVVPLAVVYLHDMYCPFLRFYVNHPWAKKRWCDRCKGLGREKRPSMQHSDLFLGILRETEYGAEDAQGLRRCLVCHGQRTVRARYGLWNDLYYMPGFDPRYQTAPPRNRGDILYTIKWCDDLIRRLRVRPTNPVEQLGRDEVMSFPE